MANKKGHNIIPLDESEYTSFEDHELSSGDGFADGINEDIIYESTPTDQIPIKVFSFNSSSENKGHSTDINIELAHNLNISKDNNSSVNNKISPLEPQNLSASPVQKIRGLTPKIDGESFDVKRCYQFRASTLKKLNQIKGESDNFNIYLNEIIDSAICFYHKWLFK